MKPLSLENLRRFFNAIKEIFATKEELSEKLDIIIGPDGKKYIIYMDENNDMFLKEYEE